MKNWSKMENWRGVVVTWYIHEECLRDCHWSRGHMQNDDAINANRHVPSSDHVIAFSFGVCGPHELQLHGRRPYHLSNVVCVGPASTVVFVLMWKEYSFHYVRISINSSILQFVRTDILPFYAVTVFIPLINCICHPGSFYLVAI